MSVTIRRARLEDAAAICQLQSDSIRAICRSCYSPVEIEAWAGRLSPRKYAEPLESHVMFVALTGEQIVGFSQLDPDQARVKAVYVAPDAIRRGVGRRLLQMLESAARERGICRVSLDATLNAEAFYEHSGYRAVGPERHPVTAEVNLACIHMEKVLA